MEYFCADIQRILKYRMTIIVQYLMYLNIIKLKCAGVDAYLNTDVDISWQTLALPSS